VSGDEDQESSGKALKEAEAKPHYHGHRDRLRDRLLARGGASLADYEVLEFLLFGAKPRGDMKPLAKDLLARFAAWRGCSPPSPPPWSRCPAWARPPSPP